ncbi:MAG: single-stranded DNA-binding protein [Chloroflexi bacterium]|nr:single-stranded DNA-binding protein [Chloroflexota bacterium]
MYQSITVVGRLGRDPEMRYMPNGDPVTSFSIATDRQYNDKNGQKVKETTWFRVSVFGKQAEIANQYLNKGKMVLVEGRLRVDPKTGGPQTFTRQDGVVSASFEIAANALRFLSPKDEGSASGGGGGGSGDMGGGADASGGEDMPF